MYRQTFDTQTGRIDYGMVKQLARGKALMEIERGRKPRRACRYALDMVLQVARSLKASHEAEQRYAAMAEGEKLRSQYLMAAMLARSAIPPNEAYAEQCDRLAALTGQLIASNAQVMA